MLPTKPGPMLATLSQWQSQMESNLVVPLGLINPVCHEMPWLGLSCMPFMLRTDTGSCLSDRGHAAL